MNQILIEIIEQIKEKFIDTSDLLWTSYESAKDVRDELEDCISMLNNNNNSCLENLNIHFLPTSTFQEHSIQNGWTKEYLDLAEKFDRIYTKKKNYSYQWWLMHNYHLQKNPTPLEAFCA